MRDTALSTTSVSYFKVCDTFGAADCAAARTDLSREALINLDVLGPVPDGFVAELGSKLRPTCIEYGFRHTGPGEARRIHVANANASIGAHESRGFDVMEMSAAIGDLSVDCLHSLLAPGALCDGERFSVLGEVPGISNLLAGGEHGKGLEAQVDTNFARAAVPLLSYLDLQVEVPATAGILREAAGTDLTVDRAALPEAVSLSEKDHGVAVQADRP